jgi:hypothetical protein
MQKDIKSRAPFPFNRIGKRSKAFFVLPAVSNGQPFLNEAGNLVCGRVGIVQFYIDRRKSSLLHTSIPQRFGVFCSICINAAELNKERCRAFRLTKVETIDVFS